MFNRAMLCVVAAGALVAASVGCTHESDVRIRNPLSVMAVDTNRIVRDHENVESGSGLPRGTLNDEASLISANPKNVCFSVTMHELAPVDLARVEAKLSAPKIDPILNPKVQAEAPAMDTFNGLLAERRETGSETICVSRDSYGGCLRWRTQPTYATVMVPGPVNVYTARGSICFRNRGVLVRSTQQMTLELSVPVSGRSGMFGMQDTKDEDFTWGFVGAGGGGDEEEGDANDEGAKRPAKASAKAGKRAKQKQAKGDEEGEDN